MAINCCVTPTQNFKVPRNVCCSKVTLMTVLRHVPRKDFRTARQPTFKEKSHWDDSNAPHVVISSEHTCVVSPPFTNTTQSSAVFTASEGSKVIQITAIMMNTMRELSRSLTYHQRYVLALVRTVTGSLSFFCSAIIIYKIYLRYQEQKAVASVQGSRPSLNSKQGSKTYYRMMLMTSIIDVMYSFWAALSVLPVPKESGGVFAYGNVATCSTQSFFVQASPSIVIYMATLNIYFMLKIRYNIPDIVIEQRYEIWLHAFPIATWLILGVTGLSLKIFGPLTLPELGCWLGSYPPGCLYTNSCTRGYRNFQDNDWFVWTFSYIWLFICFFIVLVNSILIYSAIRKQERRNEQYLAAKLQKENSSSMTKMKSSMTNQLSVPELSLPDFDFLQQKSTQFDLELSNGVFFVTSDTVANDDQRPAVPAVAEKPEAAPLEEERPIAPTAPMNSDTPHNKDNKDTTGNPPLEDKADARALVHRHVQANANRIKQSRTAAVQSSCYVLSSLFTAVWTFMPWVGYKLLVETRVRFFFAFMVNIAVPAQGIFNLFIFVRLHYIHLRETKKEWSRIQCFRHCLFCPA
jgi:hypothetical protein